MSHLLLLCSIIIMFPSGRCPPTDHYFHNNNNNNNTTTTTNTSKYYLLFHTPRCLRQLQQPGQALSVPPPAPWPRERGGYGARWCTGDAPIPAPLRSVPAAPGASPPPGRSRAEEEAAAAPPPPRHKVTPLCLHVPGGRAPPTAHGGVREGAADGRRKSSGSIGASRAAFSSPSSQDVLRPDTGDRFKSRTEEMNLSGDLLQ